MTSERPKVLRTCQFLTLLAWKCASRHNGVHFIIIDMSTSKSAPRMGASRHSSIYFFDVSTSKSGPSMVCFCILTWKCVAPQWRALFRHLNLQKCSEYEVLSKFWLGNVLRATTACTFSTSQIPKVVREWCVSYILTSKRASRHNGVQLFISHLARWL